MAKQNIGIGSSANDGTGDTLRDAGVKLNSVIDEVYERLGNQTDLLINIGSGITEGQVLKWSTAGNAAFVLSCLRVLRGATVGAATLFCLTLASTCKQSQNAGFRTFIEYDLHTT